MNTETNSNFITDNQLSTIREIAIQAHSHQSYGEHHYSYHLDMVAEIAREFALDNNYIAAAYLHDMIEDCNVDKNYIENISNSHISNMVWAVSGNGNNRKEKKLDMLEKIKKYPSSINLKMIDRLANMRECSKNNPKKLNMYIKELNDYLPLFQLGDSQLYQEFFKYTNNFNLTTEDSQKNKPSHNHKKKII